MTTDPNFPPQRDRPKCGTGHCSKAVPDEQVEAGAVAVSDEAVEAVAERMYWHAAGSRHSGVDLAPGGERHWDTRSEQVKDSWRRDARRVLSPHLHPASAPTQEAKAERDERVDRFLKQPERRFPVEEQAGLSEEERERLRAGDAQRLEQAGELLAVEARHRLSEITSDDLDHPAWDGPQAAALATWNDARNSLRADRQAEEQSDDKAVHPPAVGGEAEEVTVSLSLEAAEKWAKSLRCLRLELPDAVWKDACEPYLTTLRAALASTQPQESCSRCRGTGEVIRDVQVAARPETSYRDICPDCNGTGQESGEAG